MSEPTIIDTAVTEAAQAVVSDLEPAAHTALEDLKAFITGQADRLRMALPALAQTAAEHVHSVATAVLGEYESVLARVEAHLGGAPSAPGDTGTVPSPAAPVEAPASPAEQPPAPVTQPDAPADSAATPVEPVTGMAPAAGEPAADAAPTA